ncbi:MAG: hypothetical protein COB38_06025 [Gammaproteobacteria bacterium]|nr:MAG: hypothetical protein COB38_06025 [Gammaproteobacteria bacterium]
MKIKFSNPNTIAATLGAIICTFIIIYVLIFVVTLGGSLVSGLYIATNAIKTGGIGLLAIVYLSRVLPTLSKNIFVLIAVIINFASEIVQSIFFTKPLTEKIGETTIVIHQRVESSVFDFGAILFIVLISLFITSCYFLIGNVMSKKER